MITKEDIIKFAKKLTRRQSSGGLKAANPMREWLTGLVIAACIGVSGSVYASGLFLDQLNSNDHGTAGEVMNVQYDAAEVQEVLETYRLRARSFETLLGEAGTLPVGEVPPEEGHPAEGDPILKAE